MEAPNGVIERIPQRPDFVRRIVSEDEYHEMRDRGWEPPTTTDGKHFEKTFNDRVAGKQFVVELPAEKYADYQRDHMGGRLTEMQHRAIVGEKNDNGKKVVEIDNRELPREATIRRKEK
jgi:hypothetical protein